MRKRLRLNQGLEEHHFAWLRKHPERDETWLCERLRDGFHVHHLDGNHNNDSEENLVLLEGKDHMGLHGVKGKPVHAKGGKKRQRRTPRLWLKAVAGLAPDELHRLVQASIGKSFWKSDYPKMRQNPVRRCLDPLDAA
jgi:hypothetical protein